MKRSRFSEERIVHPTQFLHVTCTLRGYVPQMCEILSKEALERRPRFDRLVRRGNLCRYAISWAGIHGNSCSSVRATSHICGPRCCAFRNGCCWVGCRRY